LQHQLAQRQEFRGEKARFLVQFPASALQAALTVLDLAAREAPFP
jgi:hypothetical protein